MFLFNLAALILSKFNIGQPFEVDFSFTYKATKQVIVYMNSSKSDILKLLSTLFLKEMAS